MTVDPNSPDAPYIQVATSLREDIEAGRIQARGKLLSTRDLAAKFNVSNVTAQRALYLLRDEGLIFITPRGSFVSEVKPDPVKTTVDPRDRADELAELSKRLDDIAERVAALEARGGKRQTS